MSGLPDFVNYYISFEECGKCIALCFSSSKQVYFFTTDRQKHFFKKERKLYFLWCLRFIHTPNVVGDARGEADPSQVR